MSTQPNKAVEKAQQELLGSCETLQRQIQSKTDLWKERFASHNSEYEQFQVQQGTERLREIDRKLSELHQSRQKNESRSKQISAAEQTITQILDRRKTLLAKIADQKARILTLRKKKAKEFVSRIGKTIKLTIIADGNREEYERRLAELMRGSRATTETIKKICNSILPTELVEYIRDENAEKIDGESRIGLKWATTLIEQAKANRQMMYDLEIAPVEDRILISFEVGVGDYRPLEKLSTGQKATVIVLLTMVEGSQPIIFDQPEDALYTPFIYTEVVKTLRTKKYERQFILATHNANISIAADLDLGIILESTSTQSTVKAVGGLDDETTQKLMVLHLEGGEEAFTKRKEKLGLS